MLSDRLTELFSLLQCSNTDIARYAGCSPSNISRMRSGARDPKHGGAAVRRLAEGVCRYADHENMLDPLCDLCQAQDSRPDVLLPAVLAWLYASEDYHPSRSQTTPRSKLTRKLRRQSFGDRLDHVMTLLELPNVQLASAMKVDASLVSRYRSGIYSPYGNERMAESLGRALFNQAEKQGRLGLLAELCGVAPQEFAPEELLTWLFSLDTGEPASLAERLLRSIDAFTPGQGVPAVLPEIPSVELRDRYWGNGGLQSAVIRFLSDAAREGGELLLYSDEPMDWMSGGRQFFALWAALMVQCVRAGVHIRIIHNIDRSDVEMASAINGWLPLYISGMIEPFVLRRPRNTRFCHTVFLRPGGGCILGFFPAEAGENRWYDYITDRQRLAAAESDFQLMLSHAAPLLKVYTAGDGDVFRQLYRDAPEKREHLLQGFSVATMPEGLLERMLERSGAEPKEREKLLALRRERRQGLLQSLARGGVEEMVCPPDRESVAAGAVCVNLSAELLDRQIFYTPEEYAAHLDAVKELVTQERNYHLTLLPALPFRDIQIISLGDRVAVLRCRAPHTAFLCTDRRLTEAFAGYFSSLRARCAADRFATAQALDELRG